MLAANTLPVFKTAGQESCIWVTHVVEVTNEVGVADDVKIKYEVEARHEAEQKHERTPLDIGELFRTPPSNNWKLCYVAANEIEPKDSGWDKITLTPGIYVLGKRFDGFYEVVVDESYIPRLLITTFGSSTRLRFEFLFCYDPTQPTKTEVETSKPLVRKKFTLCLVLLALSLLDDYNTPSAIQLLEKDQDGVLQVFHKDLADLFKATECQNRKAELHIIGLYTAIDNLNLLGSFVGVTGSNRFGNFDLQAILSALSGSKAITNEYIDALDIAELISQLTTLLPIGFQSNLV
ncbi:hypothetical protein IFR05_009515 [Cadophora sp. M221]|nr:hypothetical protein IFR05_009515 [Cadophora sp. M221]